MKPTCLLPSPLLSLGALALAAVLSMPAAAATYCSGSFASGLSLQDVTFAGASASDCYGVAPGNDRLSAINTLDWGDDWTLLTKDESQVPVTFMGVEFDLDTQGSKSGSWTLTTRDLDSGSLLNLPMELDVVVVLKASNRYAAYLFDDAVFDGTDGGTWSIAFENRGGQIPDLSHMSFYVRVDEDGGIPAAIPEARTYAMMLVGLGLVAFMARRRARMAA